MKAFARIALALAAATAGAAHAEPIIGLTSQNALVRFDSATPGTVSSPVAISGLVAGDSVVGIDLRPANGQLYGLNQAGNRLYTINASTGMVTRTQALGTPLTGSFFGIDFNPTVDRLRVTSDSGQNYRINVDTGAVTTDGTLAYPASGDPNSGTTPLVVGAAYTNNFAGATTTQLYDIDAAFGFLSLQNPPNDGRLTSVGMLGTLTFPDAAFDISGTGAAFAVLDGLTLSRINLATGEATPIGAVGLSNGSLIGIAAPIGAPVPEPASLAVFAGLGTVGIVAARRRRGRQKDATPAG